jgi:hypothetical protein
VKHDVPSSAVLPQLRSETGILADGVLRTGRSRVLAGAGEECVHVGGELGVVLEQEPVGGVGVDLDLRLRD